MVKDWNELERKLLRHFRHPKCCVYAYETAKKCSKTAFATDAQLKQLKVRKSKLRQRVKDYPTKPQI